MPWGYRAMFVLLHTYRVRHGCRTLRENGTPARMDEVRAGWDLFTKYPV